VVATLSGITRGRHSTPRTTLNRHAITNVNAIDAIKTDVYLVADVNISEVIPDSRRRGVVAARRKSV